MRFGKWRKTPVQLQGDEGTEQYPPIGSVQPCVGWSAGAGVWLAVLGRAGSGRAAVRRGVRLESSYQSYGARRSVVSDNPGIWRSCCEETRRGPHQWLGGEDRERGGIGLGEVGGT